MIFMILVLISQENEEPFRRRIKVIKDYFNLNMKNLDS